MGSFQGTGIFMVIDPAKIVMNDTELEESVVRDGNVVEIVEAGKSKAG